MSKVPYGILKEEWTGVEGPPRLTPGHVDKATGGCSTSTEAPKPVAQVKPFTEVTPYHKLSTDQIAELYIERFHSLSQKRLTNREFMISALTEQDHASLGDESVRDTSRLITKK